MKKEMTYTELAKETAILTAAVAIIAAAVYFFLVPSHASVSSISGLGIVLSNFIPLPLSAITMILNVVLLIIGFFTCGKEFGVKTVYTSVALPVFLGIFERIFPDYESLTAARNWMCCAIFWWSVWDSAFCLTGMRLPADWTLWQRS